MKQIYGEYKFQSIKNDSTISCSEGMIHVGYPEEYGEVKFYGSLYRLFGEPLFISEDYENAFEFIIEASDNNGKRIYLAAYSGATGPAIAAEVSNTESQRAARALMELIQKTESEDYDYIGYYMDAFLKIECGIKNGQIYYREYEMDEDEAEEVERAFFS